MTKPRTLSFASIGFWGVIIIVILLAFPGINREITFYDEGVYLVIAKALASGLGYVRESLPNSPSETLYPPLLPLSLGLIWHFFPNFPDNLVIMRILMLVAGVLFLAVSYRYLYQKDGLGLGDIEALSIVAMVGLHPFFVDFTTRLTGEMPYALLSMVSLYFYARFTSDNKPLHLGFAISFAALAVMTRTIGIALFGALVIHLLLMRRFRLSIAAAACGVVVFLPWQLWSLAAQGGYSGYPLEIALNYRGYIVDLVLADWIVQLYRSLPINLGSLIINWANFVFPRGIIGSLLVAVVTYPFFRNFWQQPRIHDLYCVLSLLLILIWPWPLNSRFLLVISPFLISYFFGGIRFSMSRGLTKRLPEETVRRATNIVIVIVVSGALVHNFIAARNYRQKAQRMVPVYTEFHRMLNWIKDKTPANSIVVGNYDPAYHLFTGRKSIRLSFPDPFSIYYTREVAREFPRAGKLVGRLRQLKACYLVDDPMSAGREHLFYRNLIQAIKRVSPGSLSPIYVGGNGLFVVYKISGCPE
ncbi:MAG: glycosyltransferase family 39 protein [Candidatus Binatia bacterium]